MSPQIACAKWREESGDVLRHQLVALGGELAHLTVVAEYDRATVVDIADSEVRSIEGEIYGKDTVHLTLVIESEACEAIDRNHPDVALGVAIHLVGGILEGLFELCLHCLALAGWSGGLHGGEIKHLGTFFECNPKALKMVFEYVSATVAPESDARGAEGEVHEVIAVIAHQSTAMGTDPHEAVGVLENVVGEVVGHARRHVEIAYVIATGRAALGIHAQGNEYKAYYGQNESKH